MLPDAPLVLFRRATGLSFREIANAPLVLLDWKCRQAGVGSGCAEPQAAPMPASSRPMHRWCPQSAGQSIILDPQAEADALPPIFRRTATRFDLVRCNALWAGAGAAAMTALFINGGKRHGCSEIPHRSSHHIASSPLPRGRPRQYQHQARWDETHRCE